MKKKLVLVIAIVLVAITSCIALAGCAPSNPADFMKKWTDSKSKAVISDGYEVGINGNVVIAISSDEESGYESRRIIEVDGDKVNVYRGYKDGKDAKYEWTARSMTLEEYFGDDETKDLLTYFNKQYADDNDEDAITKEIFKNNFKKEKGWYVGSGLLFDGMGIKITAKEMLYKYDMKDDKVEFDMKYVIGYNKIDIPKEAKDALKNADAE